MTSLHLGQLDFARTVLLIGDEPDLAHIDYSKVLSPTLVLAISMPASTSTGKVLSASELTDALFLADAVIKMFNLKKEFLQFLEGRLTRVAPNVTAIVGTAIAAQLLGTVGGIVELAKIPAGNLMVIGRQKQKELTGFSLVKANPHSGYIYYCDLVSNTPEEYKKQAQRLISNKIALAARIDAEHQHINGTYGKALRQEIIQKLEKLIEPAPAAKAKVIPAPKIEPSKKRGGKRARQEKELYKQTKIRKMANRVTFGKPEEEIIVGSNVVGLGELSAASLTGGLMRGPMLDNKLREHIKKQSEKAYARSLAIPRSKMGEELLKMPKETISGSATSMTITPGQGIKLETKMEVPERPTASRFLGTNLSFRKNQ